MAVTKPVGQGAQARKYDILSAIGAWGLASGKVDQRLALRLIVLVTARYNWAHDRFAVGQREIARMWSVDERTVKREMARLREMGWLVLQRQGARGRVSEYGLGLGKILADTSGQWLAIGPDFAARQEAPVPAGTEPQKVVPFPRPADVAGDDPVCPAWTRARAVIESADPGLAASWLRPLVPEGVHEGCLTLAAPSRYHAHYIQIHLHNRIAETLARIDPGIVSVRVIAG